MDFDAFSQTYEEDVRKLLPATANEHEFYLRAKIDALLRRCARDGIDLWRCDLLDVGCGVGLMHEGLAPHVKSLTGVDVSAASLEVARRSHPSFAYRAYEGGALPFADGSFDAVLLVCTLHHVPPAEWASFLGEIFRVLRPGGFFFVVEHNPWNPATNYIVSRCAFDADAVLVSAPRCRRLARGAGFAVRAVDFILFLPLKWRAVSFLESRLLRGVPLGAQYLGTFDKPRANG